MSDTAGVRDRLAAVRERLAAAAARAGRDPADIALVGVSKRKPAALVVEAVGAGLTHVGESYAQEALVKLPEAREALAAAGLPQPRWHFIGRLQRNKARQVAPLFDLVESVDRASLAEELDRRAAQAGRTLPILLQVDTSREPQKGGTAPESLVELLAASSAWQHLRVEGLMTIPAAASDPESARPAFARLRALRDELRGQPGAQSLRELSMGMSGDYEVAIEEGATIIRVGTAIFGPREG
jgi:pyridoxal phosphate enzyme (YggS family)